MQKWTWKNVEGAQCESIRKQCEDRNSSANRTVGTNRRSTLPGRQSHLTSDTEENGAQPGAALRPGASVWPPSQGRRHSKCRAVEKDEEGKLVRAGQADCGNRELGPLDNRNQQLMLKSGLGKLHFVLSPLKTTIYTMVQNKQMSSSCLKFVNLFFLGQWCGCSGFRVHAQAVTSLWNILPRFFTCNNIYSPCRKPLRGDLLQEGQACPLCTLNCARSPLSLVFTPAV